MNSKVTGEGAAAAEVKKKPILSIEMKTKVVQQTICNFWLTLVNVRKR